MYSLRLIFCAATQDIAVDGWALELLPADRCELASTCQTIGINVGYFLSFTVFLALNSSEFCSRYLPSVVQYFWGSTATKELLTLGGYMKFWGVTYLLFSLWLVIFVREDSYTLSVNETSMNEYQKNEATES
jgi:PAT family acetyl-CoA transporter-like MFS transporter 1